MVLYGAVNNRARTALFCYVGNYPYFCLKFKLMEQDVVKIIAEQSAKLTAVMNNLAASAEEVAKAQARLNELVLQHFPPAEGAVSPATELYYQIKRNRKNGKL